MDKIRSIENGERWLIAGSTGCGKSYLSSRLASLYASNANVLYFDSKNEGTGKAISIKTANDKIKSIITGNGQTYRIKFDGLDPGDDEVSSDLFSAIMRFPSRKVNIVLWFDEAFSIPDTPALRRIFTQGRSKGVSAIACAQRPVGIPRVMVSEATRYCVFNLNDKRDRDTVGAFVKGGVSEKPRFRFDYYDVLTDERINNIKVT